MNNADTFSKVDLQEKLITIVTNWKRIYDSAQVDNKKLTKILVSVLGLHLYK